MFSLLPSCTVYSILIPRLEVFYFHPGTVYFICQTIHFISLYVFFLCVSLSRRSSINLNCILTKKKKRFSFVWGTYSFRTAETLWRHRQAHLGVGLELFSVHVLCTGLCRRCSICEKITRGPACSASGQKELRGERRPSTLHSSLLLHVLSW